jgi:hypothetical protein
VNGGGGTYCENIPDGSYCDNGLYSIIMDIIYFREKANG